MSKGFGQLLQQAQKIQQKILDIQKELGQKQVEGSSGGGMVTAVATGNKEVVSIRIDPSAVNPGDKEMLEDLVTAAVNDALRKAQKMKDEELAKIAGGLGMQIPGIF
jgi:DNA-binding YbaB/EbfC family protein